MVKYYIPYFVYPSIDEYRLFLPFDYLNNAAVNIDIQVSLNCCFYIHFKYAPGIYLGVELSDHFIFLNFPYNFFDPWLFKTVVELPHICEFSTFLTDLYLHSIVVREDT